MNTKAIIGILVLIVAVGAIAVGAKSGVPEKNPLGEKVTVYSSPTCGCCGIFTKYLKGEGVDVDVVSVADMTSVKAEHGIPLSIQSCHTSMVGGYVVEGHVPLEIIEKLLTEKPAIKGIALPGMPAGSPGMPGTKNEQWIIYGFDDNGSTTEWMTY